jgi:hypothetical protein
VPCASSLNSVCFDVVRLCGLIISINCYGNSTSLLYGADSFFRSQKFLKFLRQHFLFSDPPATLSWFQISIFSHSIPLLSFLVRYKTQCILPYSTSVSLHKKKTYKNFSLIFENKFYLCISLNCLFNNLLICPTSRFCNIYANHIFSLSVSLSSFEIVIVYIK